MNRRGVEFRRIRTDIEEQTKAARRICPPLAAILGKWKSNSKQVHNVITVLFDNYSENINERLDRIIGGYS